MSSIPPIPHLPEGITNCRFVQLYIASEDSPVLSNPILGVSFYNEDEHGQIIIETLERRGIKWQIAEDQYLNRKKFPAFSSLDYKLVGAGWFDHSGEEFIAYGGSADYIFGPDLEQFEALQKICPDFKFKIDLARGR